VYYVALFFDVGYIIEVTNGIRHAYTPKPIILSHARVTIDRVLDWRLDLLTTLTHDS
jgi:hypothetical protein